MSTDNTVEYLISADTSDVYSKTMSLERATMRVVFAFERAGIIKGDITKKINEVTRLITLIRLAHTAAIQLQIASGPVGWLTAGLSTAATAITAYSIVADMG